MFIALALTACGGGGGGGSETGSATVVVTPPVTPSGVISAFANAGGGNLTITTPNTLVAGSVITITGTTNYNGTFTVVSATPTSFVIVAAFVANDATGTWTGVGGVIVGCLTTTVGAAGAITLPSMATVPTRFTGVAPLSVFLDASATTATSTARPFLDLEYRWNFGDAVGAWGQGARPGVSSRNTALGPVASHVYETPGTYIVTLTVTDGANSVSNACIQISVQDPDVVFAGTNTVCVSTSGNFAGCPAGAAQLTSSNFTTAVSTNIATSKRMLFRGGETFNVVGAAARINLPGPGIVGSFGGGKPVIQSTGPVTRINISSNITPGTTDWRIMDLNLDGQRGTIVAAGSNGVVGSGSASLITFLRLDIHDVRFGFQFDPNVLDLQNGAGVVSPMWDQIAIVDTTITHLCCTFGNGGNAAFLASSRFSFQGNLIDNLFGDPTAGGEHGLRAMYLAKGVISNNTIQGIPAGRANLTIRSQDFGGTPTFPGGGAFTEQLVVSDNRLVGGLADSLGGTGPNNDTSDGRTRTQVWERNLMVAGAGTTELVTLWGADLTFRNNLLDLSTATSGRGISIRSGVVGLGAPPASTGVSVLNNTFFRSDPGTTTFRPIVMQVGVSAITLQNNLAFGPATVAPVMITDQGAIGITAAGNTSNVSNVAAAQINVSPNFVTTPPVAVTDYNLNLGSYARDTGVAVPVRSDFFRVVRPQGPAIDIGATEQ